MHVVVYFTVAVTYTVCSFIMYFTDSVVPCELWQEPVCLQLQAELPQQWLECLQPSEGAIKTGNTHTTCVCTSTACVYEEHTSFWSTLHVEHNVPCTLYVCQGIESESHGNLEPAHVALHKYASLFSTCLSCGCHGNE